MQCASRRSLHTMQCQKVADVFTLPVASFGEFNWGLEASRAKQGCGHAQHLIAMC